MSAYTKRGTGVSTLFLIIADVALLALIVVSAMKGNSGPSSGWSSNSGKYEYDGGLLVSGEETEYPDLSEYSIREEPFTMDDFSWYENEFKYNGFYNDDVFIYDPAVLAGDWKGYIKYDPDNSQGQRGDFLFYADISENAGQMDLVIDWYWTHYYAQDDGHYDDGTTVYTGSFQGEEYHAEGYGTIIIRRFFQRGDMLYGVGMIETPDGLRSILCLVRPAEV